MKSIEHWKLCESMSVIEATLLMLGLDPADNHEFVYSNKVDKKEPKGFTAIKTALLNAVVNQKIYGSPFFEDPEYYNHVACPHQTQINVESLKDFLNNKNYHSDFFLGDKNGENPAYADSNNKFFAPKLAAAVKAWEAVSSEPSLTNGKTPKKALEKWLKENAQEFGLFNADGDHNRSAIEEIAKISNWKPEGGAAKTPVNNNLSTPEHLEIEEESDITF